MPAAILAAALVVSGCGGDSSPTTIDPTPPVQIVTPAELATEALDALKKAVDAVMDDSEDAVVRAADTALTKAKAAVNKVPAAERATLSRRLGTLESDLTGAKESRTEAMEQMKEQAQIVYDGIARYSGASNSNDRRYAQFNDQGNSELSATPDLSIEIGQADAVRLKPDKATMVAEHKGWTGSKWKLESGGVTYEAWVYDNRYSTPQDRFRDAWSNEFDEATGWLNGTGTADIGQHQKFEGVDLVAGNNKLAGVGEPYRARGSFAGVRGEFFCMPAIDKSCAVQPRPEGLYLGEMGTSNFATSTTAWRFKPDNMDDRVRSNDDTAFVSYGYWIRKSADGKWDVSAFHGNHRGPAQNISGLTNDAALHGTATYDGGAAGVYALSAEAGTFTADAELVADFTDNSVTGTIDGFMTKKFDAMGNPVGDAMEREWSVDLQKLLFNSGGDFVTDASNDATGLTRWTMGETAAPAAGKWEGSFYERDGVSHKPKAATGSFYAEHGTTNRIVGAFGVQDPDRLEQ